MTAEEIPMSTARFQCGCDLGEITWAFLVSLHSSKERDVTFLGETRPYRFIRDDVRHGIDPGGISETKKTIA